MAKLSSNTLFHFTTWDNLLGILENEFIPRFCIERLILSGAKIDEFAIPMISFCDIPLSQIKLHVQRYGSYGIGLKKEWGLTKGINPVLYIEPNSALSSKLYKLIISILVKTNKELANDVQARKVINGKMEKILNDLSIVNTEESHKALEDNKREVELLDTIQQESSMIYETLFNIVKYIKPYEGYSSRNQAMGQELVRFYDEREWRYVPNLDLCESDLKKLNIFSGLISENLFNNMEVMQEANSILKKVTLTFKPDDIKYIIVKEENELLETIKKLDQIKGDKYPSNTIKILTSRILTYEQINDDF